MVLLAKFALTLLVTAETQIEFDSNTLLKHIKENIKEGNDEKPIEYFFH